MIFKNFLLLLKIYYLVNIELIIYLKSKIDEFLFCIKRIKTFNLTLQLI